MYLLWDRRWRSLAIFIALMAIWAGVLTGLHFAFIWKAGGRELVEEVILRQVSNEWEGRPTNPCGIILCIWRSSFLRGFSG